MRYKVDIYSVFANKPIVGNLAPLIQVENIMDTRSMINISSNISMRKYEVTFYSILKKKVLLRWFINGTEVPLCGHGFLALAYKLKNKSVSFELVKSKTNMSSIRSGSDIFLLFDKVRAIQKMSTLFDIGIPYIESINYGRDLMIVVKNAKILRSYSPNVDLLLNIPNIGILITAIDKTTPVFRFFAPRVGITEDKGSGSVIPELYDYWSKNHSLSGIYKQYNSENIYMKAFEQGDSIRVGGSVYYHSKVSF